MSGESRSVIRRKNIMAGRDMNEGVADRSAAEALSAEAQALRDFIYENGAFDWLGTGSSMKAANEDEDGFWEGVDERLRALDRERAAALPTPHIVRDPEHRECIAQAEALTRLWAGAAERESALRAAALPTLDCPFDGCDFRVTTDEVGPTSLGMFAAHAATQHAIAQEGSPVGLDEAWKAAEAALPEAMTLQRYSGSAGSDGWAASVGAHRWYDHPLGGRHDEGFGEGPTGAIALTNALIDLRLRLSDDVSPGVE